jgi:hypothetical protein
MKRTILSALLVGATVLSVAAPAFADRWHHHPYRHYYHHPDRGYYAPPPVVYAPPPPPPVYAGPSFNITVPLR